MKRQFLYLILALQVIGLTALYLWHYAGTGYPTVMLRTLPVDPRDYLRGDYIILDYEISRLPEDFSWQPQENEVVYVLLREDNGFAEAEGWQPDRPEAGRLFIKGRMRGGRIIYDLERYFVPEGWGNPPQPITVEVSLRPDGSAQIKQLYAAGQPWP